jgi:hypothetical protein
LRHKGAVDANKVKFGYAGANEVLVKVLATHLVNAGVCEATCWAICNVAVHNDNSVALRNAGGCEMLVKVELFLLK